MSSSRLVRILSSFPTNPESKCDDRLLGRRIFVSKTNCLELPTI
jgi:hypothetical protein